jgi:hypothetical protein
MKHYSHEIAAYSIAVLATICGIWAGITCEAAWLGRAGSVVIVAGVALAASRKTETLHEKVLKFTDDHRRGHPNLVRDEYKKIKRAEPTVEELYALEDAIYDSAKEDIAVLMNERRWLFKLHEVGIVVYGTLLNGFGEWLIKGAVRCAT